VNFSVGFMPSAAGAVSGSLSFASNASNALAPATLSGTGAGLAISQTPLSFGSVPDGQTSASQTGTLTAVGANITITGVTPSDSRFAVSPAAPFTIPAGQSQQFSVTFSPADGSPGFVAGSIVFTSAINNVTQAVSGTGTPNVAISWAASTTPNVTYKVYRCNISASACVQTSPSNFTLISSGITGLTYSDISVASGQTYYYALTAVDSSNNESVFSDIASAAIP
jgi:hypothetical protein